MENLNQLTSTIVDRTESIFKNPNSLEITIKRARGETLEDIAVGLSFTREWVRQVEKNTYANFLEFVNNIDIFKGYTFNESKIININKFINDFKNKSDNKDIIEIIIYFLSKNPYTVFSDSYYYSDFLGFFIKGNPNEEIEAVDFISSIGDISLEDVFEYLTSNMGDVSLCSKDLRENISKKMISIGFYKYGEYFRCKKYTLNDAIDEASKLYFPDGINVYDEKDLSKLDDILVSEYNMKSRNFNALRVRTQDSLILFKSGRYCSSDYITVKDEELIVIRDYLNSRRGESIYFSEAYRDIGHLLKSIPDEDYLHGVISKYKSYFGVKLRRSSVYFV